MRLGHENPIWNAAHSKSDYKDSVRKFREEKNQTVSFNCHVLNFVFIEKKPDFVILLY